MPDDPSPTVPSPTGPARTWLRRTYRLEPEAEEALAARLWAAGTLGIEELPSPVGQLRLAAWFPGGGGAGAELPAGVEVLAEEEIPDRDWLAAWRETVTPFPLGGSFFVDPREPAVAPPLVPAGRKLLALPARTAFGIGSHESTRLAVELLEGVELTDKRVLDVGCGTGILSFCALLLGAGEAVAFDIDPAAAVASRQNSGLNRQVLGARRPAIFAGEARALAAAASFDLALINVIPEEILASFDLVARRLAPGGEVIFSGILAERGEALLADLAHRGFIPRARVGAGEWVAYRLGRPATGAVA